MKIKNLLPVFLLICLLISALAPSALALEEPETNSRAIVLADLDSGRIFYTKNADDRVYPASLTKIMTVMLAIEAAERGEVSLDDEVTASMNCLDGMVSEGSSSNIVPGETMSLRNLLYCATVESANEACNIIGEYISGTVAAFLELMNTRAKELGCTGTNFANTHGLPDVNHYTTAQDMYLIARAAVSHEVFMEICNTVNYTVPATNVSEARQLSNTNGLINAESPYYRGYYYEYARGVKTGHTSAAGYCLVSTAEKDGIHLLAVVLGGEGIAQADGSNYYGNFDDSRRLYNWVFNNYSIRELLSSSELVSEVPVLMSEDGASVTLRPQQVLTALLPNDLDVASFDRSIRIYSEESGEPLRAPITAGAELGEITISYEGVTYGTAKLVASTSVSLSKWEYMKSQVHTVFDILWVKIVLWVLVVLLVVYFLLVIRYRIRYKRHQEELRRRRLERERRMEEQARAKVFEEPVLRPVPKEPPKPEPPSDIGRRDYFEEFFRGDDK